MGWGDENSYRYRAHKKSVTNCNDKVVLVVYEVLKWNPDPENTDYGVLCTVGIQVQKEWGGGCKRGRSTEPVKSPLPLLPACNRLLIDKLSHFSFTQYQEVEWCSWYLNIMKYAITHAQLEVKKYSVLVRTLQACWMKHSTFYFHLCMSYRTGLNLILQTGMSLNFGENTF